MQTVVLVLLLIFAVGLIGIVLLQRSEGGGLGIGGGGGGGMGGRPKPSPLARVTWFLAIGFFASSIALTIISAQDSRGRSVLDGVDVENGAAEGLNADSLGDNLLPPSTSDEPALPPKAE
ncbi:hypothetical protein GCM10007939_08910 [Amylibacter marinus]|uniref:Protein-export membrane protein SecG n=1 Tax=Amylibacter marinus TaxID=1475483 RepID=A0ABQ5VTP6_9RHOB|nr:preprotein translocase subunit SecG [Amylibacter marinus]GLQ34608.1 hypothetical protein GCM10007939_08910 [Amylibacter marinus]